MVDATTRKTLSGIPLLQTKAGPRDKELWVQRLKEEYQALIKVSLLKSIYYKFTFSIDLTAIVRHFSSQYVQNNKDSGTDWFRLESNKEGTKWFGTCWCMHNLLKYEFKVEFDVSIFRNFCIGNEIRFQRQRILIFSPHGKYIQL